MSISVENICKSLRISHNTLNDEIDRNIKTCLKDLDRVGVNSSKDTLLVDKACELYCKWQQDYQGKAEQYKENYEELRDAMSLAEDCKCTTTKSPS